MPGKGRRLRRQWAELHGKPCPYCTHPMLADAAHRRRPSYDHVDVPASAGGTLLNGNKLGCCRGCNEDKADRSLADWLQFLVGHRDPRAPHVAAVLAARAER